MLALALSVAALLGGGHGWYIPSGWYSPSHHHHRTHHRHHHRKPSPSAPQPAPQPLPDSAGPFPKPVQTAVRGDLRIAGGWDEQCSAPYVSTSSGQIVGAYIDDTASSIRATIACAVGQFPHGDVLVGLSPNQYGEPYGPSPPVVNCYEAYAYGYGWTLAQFRPLLYSDAGDPYPCYFSQWWFDWGSNPVPLSDRQALLAAVLATGAPYVFIY